MKYYYGDILAKDVVMIYKKDSSRDVNSEIRKGLENNFKDFCICSVKQLDSIVVGIQNISHFLLEGEFGDFIGALNDGAEIEVDGFCQRYVGNNMTSGEIVVSGSVGDGAGFGLRGGNIVIKGNAGDAVGQLNKGGVVLVDGDIRDFSGLFMLHGDIIITGNAGSETGEWMVGGTIYVGGDFELGFNAKTANMANRDITKLQNLFLKYDIDADPSKFTKIIHDKTRPFYGD